MTTSKPRPLLERLNRANSVLWCELDVGSLRVRAFLVDRSARRLHEVNDGNVGYFDADSSAILVGADIADDVAEATLLHELLHAVVFALGLHIRPDGEPATEDEEEAIVNPMAGALFDALKRNGMLVIPPRPPMPARLRRTRTA